MRIIAVDNWALVRVPPQQKVTVNFGFSRGNEPDQKAGEVNCVKMYGEERTSQR
jgi:hypothetical protein